MELPRPVVVQHCCHLAFSRSNLDNFVSKKWKGQLTWNESLYFRFDDDNKTKYVFYQSSQGEWVN